MFFTSDNASGAAPQVLAALAAANAGHARSYGADPWMDEVRAQVRRQFEAPEAEVFLVATGTAANALSIALLTPPWGGVLAHEDAHVMHDECGAPEFFTGGAKLVPVAGAQGKITPQALDQALTRMAPGDVHSVQPATLCLTNVTEWGTVYSVAEIAALSAWAQAHGLGVHLDGARFANALAATGASPADMTWRAGVEVLSLGGTKNGCLGVEAVVLFDPAKAWEFQLRRKRAGQLFSKHRFLSAQMAAYLADGLWLELAGRANAMAQRLAQGLAGLQGAGLRFPVQANMVFPLLAPGTNDRAFARGAAYYPMPGTAGAEGARFVTSWSTTEAEIAALLAALQP